MVSLRSFLCKEIVVHFLLKNELNLLYPDTMIEPDTLIERNIISEQGSPGSVYLLIYFYIAN